MAEVKREMSPLNAADAGGGCGGSTESSGNVEVVGSNGPHSNGSSAGDGGAPGSNSGNNTISAAADSSDNQPGTPQPLTNNHQSGSSEQLQQQQQQQQPQLTNNSYGMYSSLAMTPNTGVSLPAMYGGGIYGTAGVQPDMQHQAVAPYHSYINNFDQYYQQQQHQQQQQQQHQQQIGSAADYGFMYAGKNSNSSDFNGAANSIVNGVRYTPYPNPSTSCNPGGSHGNDATRNGTTEIASNGSGTLPLPQSNATVSTTTSSLSPGIVSSSSPTSTSAHLQLSSSSAAGSPGGGCKLQCKKCGIICATDNELQEHIANVHGASPYGSSGYSSSPYIKEELSSGSQQQSIGQQSQGGNAGELLDLDSQKLIYPPAAGIMPSTLHQSQQVHDAVGASDPLNSMHNMQQRALPAWEQTQIPNGVVQECLGSYMQQQQQPQPQPQPLPVQQQSDSNTKPPHANQTAYYSPKQSPYQVPGGGGPNVNAGMPIKQEYGLIKSEPFAPTMNADMCQQVPPPVQQQQQQQLASSPAEFPTTTTTLTNSGRLPAKSATWKSNEARRPKNYYCPACNKWFTSSGHLKRHYNTTLHKNAVKSSGKPDPSTLPISAHHHPQRGQVTTTKPHSRRNNSKAAAAAAAAATAAQQQQPPAPVQPPETSRSPLDFPQGAASMGHMSQYSASPSPTQQTQQAQMNGISYGINTSSYQAQQQQQFLASPTNNQSPQQAPSHMSVAGTSPNNTQTVLNGHPNGLAGPSTKINPPFPAPLMGGLLYFLPGKTIIKNEPKEDTSTDLNTTSSGEQQRSQTNMASPQQSAETAVATAAVPAQVEGQIQYQSQVQGDLVHVERLELSQHRLVGELGREGSFHSSTPILSLEHNMPAQSLLTTSHHQQCQELQQQPQAMVDTIFSPIQPRAAVTLPASITDQYNLIPLGINTPQLLNNSMQLLPPQQSINTSIATTVNMDNIPMLHSHPHHHIQDIQQPVQPYQERLVLPSILNMLPNSTSIQSQLGTINSLTTQQLLPLPQLQQPLPTTQSYQQLQQASELVPLEPIMKYHTTIGNGSPVMDFSGEIITTDNSGSSESSSGIFSLSTLDSFNGSQTQQVLTAEGGKIVQILHSPLLEQTFYSLPSSSQQSSPELLAIAETPPTDIECDSITHELASTRDELDSDNIPGCSTDTIKTKKARKAASTTKTGCGRSTVKRQRASPTCTTMPPTVTLPNGRIKCLECNKDFSKPCYVTQHIKSFHSGEYPYRCAKCGKRYQTLETYEIHVSRHGAIGAFKCNHCAKQFYHRSDLRRHVTNKHTNERLHVCPICDKSFSRNDHLGKHIEIHNKPKRVPASKKSGDKKVSGQKTVKRTRRKAKTETNETNRDGDTNRANKGESKDEKDQYNIMEWDNIKQELALEIPTSESDADLLDQLPLQSEMIDISTFPPPQILQNLTVTALTVPLNEQAGEGRLGRQGTDYPTGLEHRDHLRDCLTLIKEELDSPADQIQSN